jgi:hypothetical protein
MYGPSKLFVSPDLSGLADLLIGQAAWILGLGLILFFIYRRGLQHLSINGG